MSWDPVWETIFSGRASWGYYPPEELVRFIARSYYAVPDRRAVKILEIGCGPGGGPSWYVAREGFSLYGIDGSKTAIEKAQARFAQERLRAELVCGSFDRLPWADAEFDCVFDVASLQCNAEVVTADILGEVHRVLKPAGRHFSLTSRAGSWGDGTGVRIDATSFRDVTEGPFAGMGTIRFATRESLNALYRGFRDLEIEYSIRSVGDGAHEIANWIVTCRK